MTVQANLNRDEDTTTVRQGQFDDIFDKMLDDDDEIYHLYDDGEVRSINVSVYLSDDRIRLLRVLADGKEDTLDKDTRMLTKKQAAELLNIDEEYLNKLIHDGTLRFTAVKGEHRIDAKNLYEYKVKKDRRVNDALDQMIASEQDI